MSVTVPACFRAGGVAAGIKAAGGMDLALVVNEGPEFTAAGVFTSNRVLAAPVKWSRAALSDGRLKAVVLNSGGANACTGPEGFADTHATAEKAAAVLNVDAAEVAVCSTGLIGERLPIDAVLSGVDAAAAALSPDGGAAAAEAIMTTDSRPKTATAHGAGYSVGGMAKGAGMLAPGLATMLCVLTTDASLTQAEADAALRAACSATFERLDSDGSTSTNDTVLLLASGASGTSADPEEFAGLLTGVAHDLATQLLGDAEGATKEVAIETVGAASEAEALAVSRAVARDNLVKCALFGEDPNWGRILAAVGMTDAAFDPEQLDVAVNGVQICRAGAAAEPRSKVDLSGREVSIVIDLHAGEHVATVWTNDLSHAYVHENSAYSS